MYPDTGLSSPRRSSARSHVARRSYQRSVFQSSVGTRSSQGDVAASHAERSKHVVPAASTRSSVPSGFACASKREPQSKTPALLVKQNTLRFMGTAICAVINRRLWPSAVHLCKGQLLQICVFYPLCALCRSHLKISVRTFLTALARTSAKKAHHKKLVNTLRRTRSADRMNTFGT